ncbi:DNA-binding protein [Sphingomonas lenta]|uniref:DNA-binding protein n=2 Tax=Sphingomonas lenta TaxID=1141887 RepID=A0A2A2SFH5_9SPHN|nr:DNA-binding protein [Sphingomonas lenta]
MTLQDGDANGACGLAYYAMFYAARAALIVAGEHRAAMAKTHSGLIAAFNQRFVQTGFVTAEHGRNFALESSRRLLAAYQGDVISDEAAAEAIDHATAFIAAVREWTVRRPGGEA